MASKTAKMVEPPEIIKDSKTNNAYTRGRFLGKGGFAKVYELIHQETGRKYAGKIIHKAALVKESQKEKMQQEILIHMNLKHENVVGFHGHFCDSEFIYILLELCNRRSLLELHKRRKFISEPEARYFVRQIVNGCQYLHKNKVIHRDLKLANLFLDDNLIIKIGDFGLASRITHDGEKKKTLCGTPNYIAPEVLSKGGHSFEVDSWSLGCIVFTLLVGNPPFETNKLEDTYAKIKHNQYSIPLRVSPSATKLVRSLLNADPKKRPNMFNVLDHEFFQDYTPNCLPVSCLSTCPRFDTAVRTHSNRKPLSDINPAEEVPISSGGGVVTNAVQAAVDRELKPDDYWLGDLRNRLVRLLKEAKVLETNSLKLLEEYEDPAACPIYWVSRWVDYSDKYGLGYQLCDNSYGVVFNDITRLLLTNNEQNLQYIDENGTEQLFTLSQYPENLSKKVTLLTCFSNYMHENLMKTGENMARPEADDMARLPFIHRWFRTNSAIVLHLSNGTLQINFFDDHVKIILCPLMHAVTYISTSRDFKTYRFKLLRTGSGIIPDLVNRLRYAVSMIGHLLSACSSSAGSNPEQTKVSSAVQKAVVAGTTAAAKGMAAASQQSDKVRSKE